MWWDGVAAVVVLLGVGLPFVGGADEAMGESGRRCARVIYTGQGNCDTVRLQNDTARLLMDASAWDGASYTMTGSQCVWCPQLIDPKPFAADIYRFNHANLTHLVSNVIISGMGAVDPTFSWFDDDMWEVFVHNIGVLAGVGRDSSVAMQGLGFDPEVYGTRQNAWDYRVLNATRPMPFETYRLQATARGLAFGEEILRAWPGISYLLFYWGHSGAMTWGLGAPLPENPMGLLCAFMDGIVAAVDGARQRGLNAPAVVDGYEMSYGIWAYPEMLRSAEAIMGSVRFSAYPGAFNRTVAVGFGMCPDCAPPDWGVRGHQKHMWFAQKELQWRNLLPPALFVQALSSMLRLAPANSVVWIWSGCELAPFSFGEPLHDDSYGWPLSYQEGMTTARALAGCSD